ncbi:MAG: hypothetical protein V4858_22935 [Pseudomonadota bacterium]
MKSFLIRSSFILATLTVASAACAADFVVPVDMKNVSPSWTDANVSCSVSGPGLPQKTAYTKAPLFNGAFKGNVNVTVVLTPAEVPLAKNWYCALGVAHSGRNSTLAGNGNAGGYANQPGTPFKANDSGNY